MIVAYVWPTRIGQARILLIRGRWHAMIEDESLGSYEDPVAALDDLVGGHTFSHSSGADTSTLGLPVDLADWTPVPAR